MTDSPNKASSRTSLYLNGMKIVLAIILAGFVISRTDFGQLRAVLEKLSIPWLAIYFALFILSTLSKALQYKIVIGKDVAYPRVLNVVVMQNVTSNFFAASAGIASYVTLFRVEHGMKASRAMLVFFLTKVGDLITICCLLTLSIWWVWPQIGALQSVAILLLTGIGLLILTFFLIVRFRENFFVLLKRMLERIHLLQFSLIQNGIDVLEALVSQDQGSIVRIMKRIIVGSFLYLIVTLFWLYAGLRMFDIRLGVWEIAFSSALYYLISYIPIQIFGGLGVTEMSMMFLYGLFGPSQAELAAVLIGLRILSYLMNLALLLYLPLYGVLINLSGVKD